jgi:hypothetical protein
VSQVFARNLIEKALYDCMHIPLSDDPIADHGKRMEVWIEAMRSWSERCGEVAEGYAAKIGYTDPCDQEICDGVRDELRRMLTPKAAA